MAVSCFEGGLLIIAFFDFQLMVGTGKVQLNETFALT